MCTHCVSFFLSFIHLIIHLDVSRFYPLIIMNNATVAWMYKLVCDPVFNMGVLIYLEWSCQTT